MEAVYLFETLVVTARLQSVRSEGGGSILPETLLPNYQTTRLHKYYKTNRHCQENIKCHIIRQQLGQPLRCSACYSTDRQPHVHM